MLLREMFDRYNDAYQDLDKDHQKPKWKAKRKIKLTLMQIQKLRKLNDTRNFEAAATRKKVRKQYKTAAPEGGGL
jgi:hypothetical protein